MSDRVQSEPAQPLNFTAFGSHSRASPHFPAMCFARILREKKRTNRPWKLRLPPAGFCGARGCSSLSRIVSFWRREIFQLCDKHGRISGFFPHWCRFLTPPALQKWHDPCLSAGQVNTIFCWLVEELFVVILTGNRKNVKAGRSHQETHERLHGLVKRPEEENGSRKSQNAQFRNKQKAWRRVEAALWIREATVHRRGQEAEGSTHERTPRLQIQTQAQAQEPPQEGQVRVSSALPGRHGSPERTFGVSHGLVLSFLGKSPCVPAALISLLLLPRPEPVQFFPEDDRDAPHVGHQHFTLRIISGIPERRIREPGLPQPAHPHPPVTHKPWVRGAVQLHRMVGIEFTAACCLHTVPRYDQEWDWPVLISTCRCHVTPPLKTISSFENLNTAMHVHKKRGMIKTFILRPCGHEPSTRGSLDLGIDVRQVPRTVRNVNVQTFIIMATGFGCL